MPDAPNAPDPVPRYHDIHELLGVEVREASAERVVMALPVTAKVHQPYGVLHGGVSALLAESAASYGAAMAASADRRIVGIELNASHLRMLREGTLIATATPVRTGRTVQVWQVLLTDDTGREICLSRCTLSVLAPDAAGGLEVTVPERFPGT